MPREFRGQPFNDDSFSRDDAPLDPSRLCIVHATKYEPRLDKNDMAVLYTTSHHTDTKIPRNTIHFALNHKVESHMYGEWDDKPYAIVGDLDRVCKLNGNPVGFNTVDTCWDRGQAEALLIPDATIVRPAKEQNSAVMNVINDNLVEYKTANFTADDVQSLIDSLRDNYKVNRELIRKVQKIADDPHALENPENQKMLCQTANKAAVDMAIKTRGYQVMEGGMHGWSVNRNLNGAFNPLFKKLGASFYQHSSSTFSDLDRGLAQLRGACDYLKTGAEYYDPHWVRKEDAKNWIKTGFKGFDVYVQEYIFPKIKEVSAKSIKVANNTIRQIRHDYYDMLRDFTQEHEKTRWQTLIQDRLENARNQQNSII